MGVTSWQVLYSLYKMNFHITLINTISFIIMIMVIIIIIIIIYFLVN